MRCRAEAGLALLVVLWALALGSGTVLAGASAMTYWRAAAENRIALTRERWAQEACLALVRADFQTGAPSLRTDTMDVARGAWCVVEDLDPSLRINLNVADSVTLVRLLGRPAGLALHEWRGERGEGSPTGVATAVGAGPGVASVARSRGDGPLLRHVRELARVQGVPPGVLSRVVDQITIRGDGRVDVNRAPPAVLRALSVLRPAEADRLLRARAAGRPLGGVEDLIQRVGVDSLAAGELLRQLRFAPGDRVVRVVSGVHGPRELPLSAMTVTMRPRDGTLVVLAREIQ